MYRKSYFKLIQICLRKTYYKLLCLNFPVYYLLLKLLLKYINRINEIIVNILVKYVIVCRLLFNLIYPYIEDLM